MDNNQDLFIDLIPKDAQRKLVFFVNGKKVVEPKPDPEWTLLWYLRKILHLTGTKYGCGEGGCGACTVMVSKYARQIDQVKHIAVNACLTPVCAMHGLAVTTVEGICSAQEKLHPVQERLAKAHGSQCGFCTPGIVMSMYTLLRNRVKIEYEDIDTALQGNLCRCTGYRPILESFKTFMEGWERQYINGGKEPNGCIMGEECCKIKKLEENAPNLYQKSSFQPYDPTQEPIYPPELKLNDQYEKDFVFFKGDNIAWIRPTTLEELLLLKKVCPQSKIVVGNTEIGVEMKFKNMVYPILLSPPAISDLNFTKVTKEGIVIGASTSLTEVASFLQEITEQEPIKGKVFKTMKEMLHWFAGNQIRNVASLAGNIITASPISDINPILMASSAKINVCSSKRGYRKIEIDEKFFTGYRKTIVKEDEIVVSVEIPYSEESQFFQAYKQAKRKDDDISIVTAAFNVKLEKNSNKVLEAKLCYGGMAPTTVFAQKTSNLLRGLFWNKNILTVVFDSLTQEFQLDVSTPGGMAGYRKTLCLSLFFKFYLYVQQNIINTNGFRALGDHLSGADDIPRLQFNSSQYFEIKDNNRKISDSVGKPVQHQSAFKQVTGEAIYCDDLPRMEGEHYLKLIFSTESYAKIKSIDPSDALLVPGVVAFFSAKDLDAKSNKIGPIIRDEEIFSSEVVNSRACVIGAIVAKSEKAAREGKQLVKVIYEKLNPVILTIEDAIEHRSFFSGYPRKLVNGNVENAFAKTTHIREGHIRNGAQEHFYLETISAFAVRKEDELEIIATTQSPYVVSAIVSQALRIPVHKIVSKVKRIGGGFGGKETRSFFVAVPTAIAAYKLKKPVRTVLDRDEDMQTTGYRHPFLIKYRVAFNDDGKITGCIFDLFSNAGYSMDLSCATMERASCHIENSYNIPNIEINEYVCRTNMPTNTAFRGFGVPQAILGAESMIRDVANALGKSYEEVAEINMYREGNVTHYNQILTHCTLSKCWKECIEMTKFYQRKTEVEIFNRCNRWKKKGITLVPCKYGISFQLDVLNQGGALILVYKDGSVLISIGGIEMGQGLFTKMIQVASRALEVDISKIHISEAATDKVPNSIATAASVSSDLYGMAIVNACKIINDRLQPFKDKNPDGKWEDWVIAAFEDRVSLSATGFHAFPKIEYDKQKHSGNLFEYFTYGVACSEVIIDCLTGDHQVLRTDIVMDVGESLNPAIDIGQIEGAFMQGYGLYTMEEMLFAQNGEVLSRGPGAYKIPGFSDVPKEFNVSLLKGAPNPRAVYSSKAIGEPPLALAASVFFAIKEAIKSARLDAGASPNFTLEAPATCARIRMACEDEITKQVIPSITKNGKPWNIVP